MSRKGHEYRRKRLQELARALSAMPHGAILNGGLVCLDDEGRTLFYDMMFNRAPVHFYAFDILWLGGEDLRDLPIVLRKHILEQVVPESPATRWPVTSYIMSCISPDCGNSYSIGFAAERMREVDTAFLEDLWGRWDEDDATVLAGRLLTAEQRHLPGVSEGAPQLSGHRRQIWIDYDRLQA